MESWSNSKLPERLPFTKKRLGKKVIISYILDYVIIVALIVTFYALDAVEPFHQPFSLQNYTLHYPFAVKERIPVPELVIIAVAAPAAIIAFYTLVIDGIFSHQAPVRATGGRRRLTGRYRLKDRLWELNCGVLGLMLGVAAAFTITGALKNAIGKPRPDLIDRCKVPQDVTGDPPGFKLHTHDLCTQKDNAILKDGFRSFPSGHSSTAFAGLFYLSLYLAAKLHVLDAKGEVWKTFIVMVPTLAAALVAGSRIMDARHHPFDVLSGSALGLLCAWGAYRQYFPPVSETWRKGRAYPIRAWGREPEPPHTIQVQEDIQPLPLRTQPTDMERGAASGIATSSATAVGSGEHGGNVFRQQISQSQRRRQADDPYQRGPQFGGVQHSDTMDSTLSQKVLKYQNTLPGSNPFEGGNARSGRQEGYYSSSSDDDDNYELQQSYTLSAPHGGAAYNPVAGTFTDTGYHPPQGISPIPTPPPANVAAIPPPKAGAASADITDLNREFPTPQAPPHAPDTTS